MDDIKDKIAKLLALADSPNENEAKVALLKARKLMAEHKLRPEECKKTENVKVVVDLVDANCTKMTDNWLVDLSIIIASHYCCKAYYRHYKGAKRVQIGFAGLEDDFAVCKRIFLYAYKCVKARCKELKHEALRWKWPAKDIREMCNAFGWGFCKGIEAVFDEQDQQNQEWGLVLAVPQAVEDATKSHKKSKNPYSRERIEGWHGYADVGYAEGKKFDPTHSLEETEKPLAMPK